MKRMTRILAFLLTAMLLLVSLTSCAAARPIHASPRATRAVATVGDVEILYEELYFITMRYIAELKLAHGENALDDEANRQELERFVWESFVSRDTALISLGYEYGIDVYKGDIADSVQELMDGFLADNFDGDRKAYVEELAKMHMTDHYVRKCFGVEDYLATDIVVEMAKRGELVTDDAAVLETLNSDKFIRTVHVFINKSNRVYSDAEHRAHAAEIQAAIAACTDSDARYEAMCDAIGGKYNNDFGDPLGNGYYFTHGEMDEAYEGAAFALADYGVSDVVETDDGYYIIMRLPKDTAYINEHFETLRDKSYFVTLNQKVDEKLATMTLSKTNFGEKLDLTNLAPIDPDGGNQAIVIVSVAAGAVLAGVSVMLFLRARKKRK
ncbi:MAG: SurA N-terminal domain-containing protein [Clostridia bacterium]|nr:SurA N-terminal domain-containing protein [Clostridia bacterium]